MKTKHYTIPIFIPELACPFECVFCNQKKISGRLDIPSPDMTREIIKRHLSTIPDGSVVEIGFFGGNFTGIDAGLQEAYLAAVQDFLLNGPVQSIRLSTRPDYISQPVLEMLKRYGVGTIELGAQSLDDEVLIRSGRGHKAMDVENSSRLIIDNGFSLGLQMMIGLPGDSPEKTLYTAKRIVELGADNTRIYPALVVKGTKMEEMYNNGKYSPLSVSEAVDWTKEVYKIFEKAGVAIIRVGLHPSDGLLDGSNLAAGPFHVSFRELVLSRLWAEAISDTISTLNLIDPDNRSLTVEIAVPKEEINYAVGYNSSNKKALNERFAKVNFKTDASLNGREHTVKVS